MIDNQALAGYDKNYIGEMKEHRAVYEDTLIHLAREYDLGFVELLAANPELDPWIPGEGARVILPTKSLLPDAPREGIVINLPEMRLYAYVNGDEAPTTFPIGIGREGLGTPMGKTSIVRKKVGPEWRPTERMRKENPKLPKLMPPGPDNPLGTHALYLGWPQYAIHGTARPFGIGRRVSSGCIRLYPENIKILYDLIPVGTPVNVVNQSIKVAWIGDELYLEAHPSLEQAIAMEESGSIEHQKLSDDEIALIRHVAGESADHLNWPRIRRAARERQGYPVRIARRGSVDSTSITDEESVETKETEEAVEVSRNSHQEELAADIEQEKGASKIPAPSLNP